MGTTYGVFVKFFVVLSVLKIVDGHTYMLDEAVELKKRIDKKCKFKT